VRITIDLPEEFPPVSNYDAELHGLGFSTASPVLRILFTNNRRTDTYLYGELRDLVIDNVRIDVDVDGVKNLIIQNELGVQDPAKPFMPFGPSPSNGAAWYVGSNEVFSKDLKTLTLNVEWHDYPKSKLQEYYNYTSDGSLIKDGSSDEPLSNSDFNANIRILRNGEFVKGEDGQALFPASLDNADDLVSESTEFSIGRDPELPEQSAYTVDSNRGFIRIELQGPEIAFGHKVYPRLLMQELADNGGTIPVEPYTPKVKSLTLNYTSEAVFSPSFGAGMETDQFYHLLPFGRLKKIPATAEESGDIFLAPQFAEMADGKRIDFEGILYIGLKNLSPPQQLSLLFKMSEGSGDPGLDPPAVYWYYLANRQWQRFEPREIVSDATNELLETGLLKLDIPEGAGGETTILPGELTWIKAAITKNAPAVSSVIAVHAQALAAEFVDRNNDPTFLGTSLPPESIGTLKEKQAAVKKVNQPYASEGGKVAETDNGFHRRTSERLRHKERGITIWDYERLVLQHFPSIYKAKCINHSTYGLDTNGGTMDTEFAPGYVTVIVIPDLSDKTAFDPLKPRASLGKLKEIKCFLKKRLSVFAAENLDVSNPLFEQVQVEFNVEFREGRDEGYYQKQLVEDIAAFLSPWAFREGEDIVFGGAIHKSVILNFVEERPYVDFVTEFRMHHFIREKSQNSDVNEIIASESRSILVSHDTHIVNGNLIQGI
ncbi:MAG: hypothetical protein R3211_08730, partial [Balneolaceae bacterium]|nr:hypothetical protein [Balneolaceae bacterium]